MEDLIFDIILRRLVRAYDKVSGPGDEYSRRKRWIRNILGVLIPCLILACIVLSCG